MRPQKEGQGEEETVETPIPRIAAQKANKTVIADSAAAAAAAADAAAAALAVAAAAML